MNCERFEERLDDFLGGRLSDVEQRAAEQHFVGCERCRALAAALQETLSALSPDALLAPAGPGAPDLSAAILERTSGGACGRAQMLLCDLVDAALAPADAALVSAHLEHCSRCAGLHRTLVWLRVQLPLLAEVPPDPALAGEIFSVTSAQPNRAARRVPRRHAVREWLQRLAARPRFAWEVAYVGTLLVVLLFGTSVSPFRNVPPRALAAIQIDPRAVLGTTADELRALHGGIDALGSRAWDATGERLVESGRAWGADFAGRHPGMNAACNGWRAHGAELRQHVAERNFAGVSLVLQSMGQDARAFWTSLQAGETEPRPAR